MSGISGAGGATETLLNMINFFADPKAAREKVEALQKAAGDAEARVADATQRERNAQVAEQAARRQRDEATAMIVNHDRDKAQFEQHKNETNAALLNREGAVASRERAVDELEQRLRAEYGTKMQGVSERESAVARRERDAETRDAELQRREDSLQRRERAVQRAFAET